MRKVLAAASLLVVAVLPLTACVSEEEQIRKKGELVKECVEAGGQWYNTQGWGDDCNFDTRDED